MSIGKMIMKNSPLVTIVTPSFNQAKYLERTIQSVLSQDYPNLEYIITDGGSNDGTVELIKKYEKRLAWWVSEKDRGQTDAINKGFARARGEILAWLNSDDTYEPGAIKDAVTFFTSHPDISSVYSQANYIDENDKVIGRFPAAQTNYRKLRQGYVHVPQQACFFRANLWKKVGPLDPSFYFAMDYDLWVRLAKEAPMAFVPERTWANFRLHSDAKTISADDRCWPEMLKVHYREGGSKVSPIVLKYYVRKLVAPIIRGKRKRMFK
jgi:glycosyltransferase involved in cell wall biosynthesis